MSDGPPESEELERLKAAHEAALRALQAAVRDTTRLTRLLTVLSARAPLEVLLDQALSTLSEIFSCDVVALFHRGAEGRFSALAAVGIPEHLLGAPVSDAEGSYLAQAVRTRAPVVAEDALQDHRVDALLRELEVRTVAWLPVAGDHGVPAAMLMARCHPKPFASADLDLLVAMGYRIGLVLERAQAEAQLREAQERLLQSEKLALAGQLAGSVAHEVNNPLASVLANLSVLQAHLPAIRATFRASQAAAAFLESQPGAEAQAIGRELAAAAGEASGEIPGEMAEILSDLEQAAKRIQLLVGSFTALSAAGASAPEARDLRALVADCVAQLPADTGRPELVHEAAPNPCIAWVAPSVLEPALCGLLRFLLAPGLQRDGPGRVVIRTELHRGQPSLMVSDESVRLPEEQRRRIFEPCLEEVKTSSGCVVRLSMAATFAHHLLRQVGAEPSIALGPGGRGVQIRFLLPAPPTLRSD